MAEQEGECSPEEYGHWAKGVRMAKTPGRGFLSQKAKIPLPCRLDIDSSHCHSSEEMCMQKSDGVFNEDDAECANLVIGNILSQSRQSC
jgi:hypothetical protein